MHALQQSNETLYSLTESQVKTIDSPQRLCEELKQESALASDKYEKVKVLLKQNMKK